MRQPHPGSFHDQATLLRRQSLQDGGLPFTNVFTEEPLADELAALGGCLTGFTRCRRTIWRISTVV